jgi:isopentenyl-diphosphate delta-isomerase
MSTASTTWSAEGLSQDDLMNLDHVILVDPQDTIVGSSSKKNSHRFVEEQKYGQLHRAFSVFLFDSQDRLLLQQRASTKITFPSLWTNTCCSHPLAAQNPSETDDQKLVGETGLAPGACTAAVRKLDHELGIRPEDLPASSFRYMTRLHYCAPDPYTGSGGNWGEHEMDYVLLARAPDGLATNPNPEEVDAVQWVTKEELKTMMQPESGLKWSPWFRIIVEQFLPSWWDNLEGSLAGTYGTDKWGDVNQIMVPPEALSEFQQH